ncbi:MAG: hypothetical protein U5K38_13400 [Woeseiaceae bacterium]|nr:hypothetical protein [Woeseiaceae bacterium]
MQKTALVKPLFTPPALRARYVYGILQGFASLESRHFTRRNLDGFAGSRVASGACCTGLDRERAESNQRYGTAA